MAERYLNLIGEEWVPAQSDETFEDRNPARWSELLGSFPRSGPEDVDAAVAAARAAYRDWRATPPPRRGEILLRAGLLLEQRKEELARTMTQEMGKVLEEARGDVQEAIDMAFFAAGLGRRPFGETIPSELPDKICFTWREPVGVVGVITPWNFPVAVPSWKLFPALMAGNTIVFKPAEDTPLCGVRLAEVLLEAGLPAGVLNLVHGTGPEAGASLVAHPDVNCISFTGSTEVGKEIAVECGRTLKRVGLELGGKNAIVVLDDASLELAVDGAVWAAFGTTGQRCTATSRVYVERTVAAEFEQLLREQLAKLVVGDLADEGGMPAKRRDAGGRIAGAAARGLDRLPHQSVEALRLVGLDEAHRSLDQLLADEEVVLGLGDHVDDRIADAEDVEFCVGHVREG